MELERSKSTFSYLALWRLLRKHWATALATMLAVSLAVVFNTLGQTKIYQASATLQFDPNPPRPLGQKLETSFDMGAGNYWDNQEYYETQYKIILSMRIALAVASEIGLNRDAAFLANLPAGAQVPPAENVSEETAALKLRSRLSVEPIKNSRLALVKLEDADPQRAQRVLSTVIESYVNLNLEDALVSTNAAGDWLRGQLEKLKVDLESSELALHTYKEGKNILSVAFDDQSNMLRAEMNQLNEILTGVRGRREEISARRQELAKIPAEDPSNLPASELTGSTLLQALRNRYEDAVRDRDSLIGEGKGLNHPEVQAADARVGATRSALLAEVKNIQGALDRDLAVINRQEAGLSGLFERAKKQALDLNLLEIEYNRLRRSKDNTEKLYSLVLERSKESDLARMLRVNNLRIIDRPLLPGAPIRPRTPITIALGIFAGIVLGIGVAITRGVLDRSLKTPEDIDVELGMAFLGLLPETEKNVKMPAPSAKKRRNRGLQPAPELVLHSDPTSGIAEAARTIRTNLIFMAPDHPYKTLLVTSAGPSEGKTTVASCIAIAMAQAGQRVVLIDCDLRRPRIHRIFDVGSDEGVTTALLEESEGDAVRPTEIPNLSVIAAGPIPPNPAELLHSERFRRFLGRISGRFDRVIIDSPPLVAVTDATILSTLVDGTVLVIRAFSTNKDLARHALRLLVDVGAKLAGAVLNAVNLSRHEYKYSYYKYQGDGYYSSAQEPPVTRRPDEAAPPPS